MDTSLSESTDNARNSAPLPARGVAVIDVGASSIRMSVGEIQPGGQIRILDRLSQAVRLGKDTFTRGSISTATIEECVRVLKAYRHVLDEYQITNPEQIKVVATSAVREALNRLQFLDRIYMSTGLEIRTIDEAEIGRVTYLGLQPLLQQDPVVDRAVTVIVEVGGGSMEVLIVHKGDVLFSHTYRLGSLRLRETLEAYDAPRARMRSIMESQIDRTVEEICAHVATAARIELIALGGDIRFAASQLLQDWSRERLASLPTRQLGTFTDKMLAMSDDELIRKYRLTFADAETLGPALLTYVRLAKAFQLEQLRVADFNLRDALLNEIRSEGRWTHEFGDQVIRSAINLGRKYNLEERHGLHVAELCSVLFDALRDEHLMGDRFRLLLRTAALLHEIGQFINNRGHHKHSMYLIINSEIFGLSKEDMRLVALVARYHRRASPKPTHEAFMSLSRENRIAVAQMAAILRVADSLDASRSQRIREIQCAREKSRFVVRIADAKDLSLEQLSLRQKGAFFEETFGMRVLLRHLGR